MVMTLRVGDKLGQRDAIAQLVRMQYQRNDMDFARGNFRVRGDTIDVFPAEHSELAICASNCSTTRSRACSCSTR
jgi:excinuclease ABC subunit B